MPSPEAERQLANIEQAIQRRTIDAARMALTALLAREPDLARAHFLMGICAFESGVVQQARKSFERSLELDPTDVQPAVQLAYCLSQLSEHAAARTAADRAAALGPTDPVILDRLGVVYDRAGAITQARDLFRRAVALQPGNVAFLNNLAYGEQHAGDLKAAGDAFRRILDLNPNYEMAYVGLADLSRQSAEQNFVPELERMFANATGYPDRLLSIGHALAKTYEDMGEHATSLDWLHRAKAAQRRAVRYMPERTEALFAAAAATLDAAPAGPGHPSDAPVFIIGLPRTGTTLVDRILSSHPQVVSAGELWSFPVQVRRLTGDRSARIIDTATLNAAAAVDPAALGQAYMNDVAELTGAASRFTDKLPFNFFYAGLIHRALPDARIVCLRRDPMDSILSNYRQLFAAGSRFHDYSYDLMDAARYYVAFHRLAERWRAALPAERYTEIAYEDLVADQEAQSRRLIDFCGLDWDPVCLDFHQNRQGVSTASAVQVRAPLYASSVGRWRKYGAGLDEVAACLAEAGISV